MRKSLDQVVVTRLKAEMARTGDSANSLAKKCERAGHKVNQTTISAILRGRQSPRVDTLGKIADVLGVEPWLLLAEPGAFESLMARQQHASRREIATVHQIEAPYGVSLQSRLRTSDNLLTSSKKVSGTRTRRRKAV